MTNKLWKQELESAVGGSGLPWRVFSAWVEQHSPMCCADLSDTRNGKECRVSLASDRFPTAPDRRAEIVRQLNASAKR